MGFVSPGTTTVRGGGKEISHRSRIASESGGRPDAGARRGAIGVGGHALPEVRRAAFSGLSASPPGSGSALEDTGFRRPKTRSLMFHGFFLCIEATDPQYNTEKTQEFLQSLEPVEVSEVIE